MNNSITKRSILLRLVIWTALLCAIAAPIWLSFECYRYFQSMPGGVWDLRVARIGGLLIANLIFTAVVAIMLILYLWVRMAKSLPDLQGWHLERPESEFCASDAVPGYTLDDYLAQEDRVFRELDALVESWKNELHGRFSRFDANSICNPDTVVDRNWNRSYVLPVPNPKGGVLLVHGLSDSPYSLRKIGERLHAEGYTVVWLRVPGHGSCPSALANIVWKDWTAAVRVAMQGLRSRLPKDTPLILGGYSNGGALSVHYAIESVKDKSLPQVDAITLFSPMLGINPLARITQLYHTVALVSGNKKAQWSSIVAEVDPFKFSSWPMNASVQAWALTQVIERKLAKLEKSGKTADLPPILAMQSVVDSTVVVPKLITVLFERLRSRLSELVLFDINRETSLSNLFNLSFEKAISPKLARTDLPYTLSVLTNKQSESHQIVVQSREGESWTENPTEMLWPNGVVSLSHLAVPMPPDDLIYGTEEATARTGLPLGTVSLRSEPSALLLPGSVFTRCRNNPFYFFMEDRVVDWLSEVTGQNGAPPPQTGSDKKA
jgi:alpha-beta hydrolase superfamily lysophospholipase